MCPINPFRHKLGCPRILQKRDLSCVEQHPDMKHFHAHGSAHKQPHERPPPSEQVAMAVADVTAASTDPVPNFALMEALMANYNKQAMKMDKVEDEWEAMKNELKTARQEIAKLRQDVHELQSIVYSWQGQNFLLGEDTDKLLRMTEE